jgi:predicted amidohydrolase YtcJ
MTLEPDIDNSFIGKLKTTIFVNGRIYTMDEKQPVVEAVVIQGNRILFAGSEEEAMKKHKS